MIRWEPAEDAEQPAEEAGARADFQPPVDSEPVEDGEPAKDGEPPVAGETPEGSERVYVAASTLRRAPRFGRFALVGIAAGALIAALAAILGPPGVTLGRGTIFLLLFLALGGAGLLVAGIVVVLAERRSLRRRPPR